MCIRDRGKAVILDIIAVGALDLFNPVAASGNHGHHVDPEGVLHTRAGDGAAVLLRKRIQAIGQRRRGGPGIDRLFAGGDDIDAAKHALLHMLVDVANKAEERYNGYIWRTFVQNFVRVVGNQDSRCLLYTSRCV